MRRPLALLAATLVGCSIRTHRVEVSRSPGARVETPENRDEAPVATAVHTDGRTFHVEAVQPRSCRTQVHQRERVVTRVEPKEKGKFWTQAVIAGAATTTAAITATQAEWWTTRGRSNFAVFLVSAPIAIGTGRRTLDAAGKMRGSTKIRIEPKLVDAGTWRECGETPLDGLARVHLRASTGGDPTAVGAAFAAGKSGAFPVVAVPSRTWQASQWGVRVTPDREPAPTSAAQDSRPAQRSQPARPPDPKAIFAAAKREGRSPREAMEELKAAKEAYRAAVTGAAPDRQRPASAPPQRSGYHTVPVGGRRIAAMDAVLAHEALEQARRDAERRTRSSRKKRSFWDNAVNELDRFIGGVVDFGVAAVEWVKDNPEAVATAGAVASGYYLATSDAPVPRAVRHCLLQEGGAFVASGLAEAVGGGQQAQAFADGVGSWLVGAALDADLNKKDFAKEVGLAMGVDQLSNQDEQLAAMAQIGLFAECVVSEARR